MPFIQQYNPYPINDDNDNDDSNINDWIEPFDSSSPEEQSVENEDHTFINSNKETDIPSTIDFQPEPFKLYSRTNKINKKTNNTNPENQSDLHDYGNYINPRRHTYDKYNFRPQPRKDY